MYESVRLKRSPSTPTATPAEQTSIFAPAKPAFTVPPVTVAPQIAAPTLTEPQATVEEERSPEQTLQLTASPFALHSFGNIAVSRTAAATPPRNPGQWQMGAIAGGVIQRSPNAGSHKPSSLQRQYEFNFGTIPVRDPSRETPSGIDAGQPQVQRKCAACEEEDEQLMRKVDAPAVQREAADNPPATGQTAGADTTPATNEGADEQMRAIAQQLEQQLLQQLVPETIQAALGQIDLSGMPISDNAPNTGDSGSPATNVYAKRANGGGDRPSKTILRQAAPQQAGPPSPPGASPPAPQPASAGTFISALTSVPEIKSGLATLQTLTMGRFAQDWSRLRTGEQIGLISTTIVIGAGALTGILSNPESRRFALDQLNGRVLPVPGVPWLRLELNTGGNNLMMGMHVDVGRFLPSTWGFGPSSPSAIGGPPQPEPLPGQRMIQRQEKGAGEGAAGDVAKRIQTASGSGGKLDEGVQQHLEQHLGADLSDVRIHTDSEADRLSRSVNAVAFTTGQDIFFSAGSYNPTSKEGQHLIAHEVVHTVQQANGAVAGTPTAGGVSISDPSDAFEQEAEQVARKIADTNVLAKVHPVEKTKKSHQWVVQRQPPGNAGNPNSSPTPSSSAQDGSRSAEKLVDFQPFNDTWISIKNEPKSINLEIQKFISDQGVRRSKTGIDDLDTFINATPEQLKFINPLVNNLTPAKPLTDEDISYRNSTCNSMKKEAQDIKRLCKSYETNFELEASNKVSENILNESKSKIEQERDRLGIRKTVNDYVIFKTESYNMSQKEDENIKNAAGSLLDELRNVTTASAEVQRIKKEQEEDQAAHNYGPHGELPPGGPLSNSSRNFTKELSEANDKLNQAKAKYNLIRAGKEAANPILVSYQLDCEKLETASVLHKLTFSPQERAETLGKEIDEKLKNIEEVRKKIQDKPSRIWRLSPIVEATKATNSPSAYLASFNKDLIEPLRSSVVIEKVAHAEFEKVFVDVALGVLAVGAALLATPAAGAAVATLAGAVEAGATLAIADRSLDEYLFETAAQGTDFDKAKAISQGEEPSLFWLALDLVPVGGMAAKGALKAARATFKSLVALRREAMAAKAAAELTGAVGTETGALTPKGRYQKALSELESAGNTAKQDSSLGTKLKDEVLKSESAKGAEGTQVAKPTREGHLIVASPEGITRCSPPPCPLLRVTFAQELKENEQLAQELARADELRSAGKLEEAANLAANVEAKLITFRDQKLLYSTGAEITLPYKKARTRAVVISTDEQFVKVKYEVPAESGGEVTQAIRREDFQRMVSSGDIVPAEGLYNYLINNRPSHRKGVVESVWENAKKQNNGKVICPLSKKQLFWDPSKGRETQWHMGHKENHEYWKLADKRAKGEITHEKFLDEFNNPSNYEPQDPIANMSHQGEAP